MFHAIESILLSQLHLHNCKGSTYDYPNFDKVSTLLFVDAVHNIMIDKIHITSNGSVGIALYFEFNLFHSIWLQFYITNSTISTGDIGVYSGGTHERETSIDDDSIRVEITSTSFEDSCLHFETISFVSYNIRKSRFEHCQCSPVLSFNGVLSKISLREITVTDNELPVLMQVSQAKHIGIDGKFNFFHRNKGVSIINDSAVELTYTMLQFINNTVASSKDIPGTILFIRNSSFQVFDSTLYFRNNHGQLCGGITAIGESNLIFKISSRIDFIGNAGEKGGALSLYKESTMLLQSNKVYINFHNNTATKGGGVYVEDVDHIKPFSYELTKLVIEVVEFENNDEFTHASAITFSNNTAHIGGNAIYGGWVDWSVNEDGAVNFNPRIKEIIVLQNDDNNDIASSPLRACLCFDNIPNCTTIEHTIDVYPGQTVTLSTVAVGQRFGTVTTFMTIDFMKSSGVNNIQGTITDSQYVQTAHKSCTPLNYTIISPNKREQFVIRSTGSEVNPRFEQELLDEYPQLGTLFEQLSITLTIKECPPAFLFDKNLHTYICLPSLGWLGLGCDLNSFRIL